MRFGVLLVYFWCAFGLLLIKKYIKEYMRFGLIPWPAQPISSQQPASQQPQPASSQPANQPAASQAASHSQPASQHSQPGSQQPAASSLPQPASQPASSQPASHQPAASQPAQPASQPAASQPASQPEVSQPSASQPSASHQEWQSLDMAQSWENEGFRNFSPMVLQPWVCNSYFLNTILVWLKPPLWSCCACWIGPGGWPMLKLWAKNANFSLVACLHRCCLLIWSYGWHVSHLASQMNSIWFPWHMGGPTVVPLPHTGEHLNSTGSLC